jgi:hypothetical protein
MRNARPAATRQLNRQEADEIGGTDVRASRFDTIPSRPIMQACRNTTAPSSAVCSLKISAACARANSFSSFALRSLSGSVRRSLPCPGRPALRNLAELSPLHLCSWHAEEARFRNAVVAMW